MLAVDATDKAFLKIFQPDCPLQSLHSSVSVTPYATGNTIGSWCVDSNLGSTIVDGKGSRSTDTLFYLKSLSLTVEDREMVSWVVV